MNEEAIRNEVRRLLEEANRMRLEGQKFAAWEAIDEALALLKPKCKTCGGSGKIEVNNEVVEETIIPCPVCKPSEDELPRKLIAICHNYMAELGEDMRYILQAADRIAELEKGKDDERSD